MYFSEKLDFILNWDLNFSSGSQIFSNRSVIFFNVNLYLWNEFMGKYAVKIKFLVKKGYSRVKWTLPKISQFLFVFNLPQEYYNIKFHKIKIIFFKWTRSKNCQ